MDSLELEEKPELDSAQQNKIKNETLTTELHFELLKQYAWLSSAAIGAIVVLVQLKAIEADKDLYVSLGFFVMCFGIGVGYLAANVLKFW